MKLVHMIGAGVMVLGAGIGFAWLTGDRSVQASIANSDANVVTVEAGDEGIADARTAARGTFDQFWNRVSTDSTGLDAISIKVAVPHANGAEHLWMTGCKSTDAQSFFCVVSNQPVQVPLKLGSSYGFKRDAISDWMYRQDGMIHGGYSIRELLPTLPADQAEAMTAMLAPLPQ